MPRKKKPRRAAQRFWVGYCRKSTDQEDKQIFTLQDQAAMIRNHYESLPPADRAGCPLLLQEEARSAYHPGRPVFDQILRMADAGQVRGVIVVHPNRISRNHADSGSFVQRLVDGQIGCLDTTGGKRYTGRDSNDIFMLTLEGAMSWKDSRDKGERILQAMRMRAAEGKHMGPVRPGYAVRYRPDGSRVLEQVPEVASAVRRIFELAATGAYSIMDLVEKGFELGLRTRACAPLSKSGLHGILRDPIYKGYIRFDGSLARGVHRAIIDADLWDRVQDVLSGRRTETARPKDPDLGNHFLFGHLLRCPRCMRRLCAYRAKGKYVYYECKNPGTGCEVCASQPVLLAQLPERLDGLFLESGELDSMRETLRRSLRGPEDAAQERRALASAFEAVQREIADVFNRRPEAVALGIEEEVDFRLATLKERRDSLRSRLDNGREKSSAYPDTVIRAFELAKLLQEAILWGSREEREPALNAVGSNFFVDGKKLIPKLRTPFREYARRGGRSAWWSGLTDVRTEVEDTVQRLEQAHFLITEQQKSAGLAGARGDRPDPSARASLGTKTGC
jgi:site-specific DNA recombinase